MTHVLGIWNHFKGNNGPSDATGGFNFDGVNSVMETLELLDQKFDLSKTKSFVFKGYGICLKFHYRI